MDLVKFDEHGMFQISAELDRVAGGWAWAELRVNGGCESPIQLSVNSACPANPNPEWSLNGLCGPNTGCGRIAL